jgi:hypothetical protein
MAKGRQCTEQDVVDFLINAHSASINNTFVVTDCHQAIKDLRAKELTYGGGNTTEARFGVTRFDIAKAMGPEEICEDVKTLIQQIQDLCQ